MVVCVAKKKDFFFFVCFLSLICEDEKEYINGFFLLREGHVMLHKLWRPYKKKEKKKDFSSKPGIIPRLSIGLGGENVNKKKKKIFHIKTR